MLCMFGARKSPRPKLAHCHGPANAWRITRPSHGWDAIARIRTLSARERAAHAVVGAQQQRDRGRREKDNCIGCVNYLVFREAKVLRGFVRPASAQWSEARSLPSNRSRIATRCYRPKSPRACPSKPPQLSAGPVGSATKAVNPSAFAISAA
jgi:hypothetical protein